MHTGVVSWQIRLNDPYTAAMRPYVKSLFNKTWRINAKTICRLCVAFCRFSYFVKDVSHTPAPLLTELRRLDSYLLSTGGRYLCSDDLPTHLDCIMLPKLQHVRVVAAALRRFQIPAELRGLWRYLDQAAYQSDLFFKTCPSDDEIVAHWLEKPECRAVVDDATLAAITRDQPPTYSFDVPPPPAL